MDAIALLVADHNRVRGLFTRFKAAQDRGDTETMTRLATRIASELDVHTSIEEQIFYPWCRDLSGEIAESIAEGLEEHHEVKVLLSELSAVERGGSEWVAKLTVVTENVEHHANEEETELFAKVRSHSDAADRKAVAERMEAMKREMGAPVLADKIDLTTTELQRLASEQEIPGRSSMGHDELAATVSPT